MSLSASFAQCDHCERTVTRPAPKVLAEAKQPVGSLAVYLKACPDEPYRGRRDAGATRTADSLSARGYVRRAGEWHSSSRDFEITDEGRAALKDVEAGVT